MANNDGQASERPDLHTAIAEYRFPRTWLFFMLSLAPIASIIALLGLLSPSYASAAIAGGAVVAGGAFVRVGRDCHLRRSGGANREDAGR